MLLQAYAARAKLSLTPVGQLSKSSQSGPALPLTHRCTSLRAIDLGGSHLLVTDELLDTIAGCCGTLRELRLNYCESFSALGLQVR